MRVACLMPASLASTAVVLLSRVAWSLEVGLAGVDGSVFSVLGLRRDRRAAGSAMLGVVRLFHDVLLGYREVV